MGCVQGGSAALAVVCASLCAQPPREGRLQGPGVRTLCTRQGGRQPAAGDGRSPDKGLVVPPEKTQTWVSLRLGPPGSIKGTLCGSEGGGAGLPGNRRMPRSHSSRGDNSVTLDLADRADTRPDGHVWDKSALGARGQHCLVQARHVASWKTEGEGPQEGSPVAGGATSAHCGLVSGKGGRAGEGPCSPVLSAPHARDSVG